jgi:hypothetical protein
MTQATSSPPAIAKLTVNEVMNEAVEARWAASRDGLSLHHELMHRSGAQIVQPLAS